MYRKDRQNEFYTEQAHKEGYPARSVYKLREIDQKYKLVKKEDTVLDLGCAPGSWLMYLSAKVGEKGRVIGVDTGELKISPFKNILFIRKNVMEVEINELRKAGGKFQVIVSDMAPSTSGMPLADAGRSLELSERAFAIASELLEPNGNFLCKIFEGRESNELFKVISQFFRFSKIFRPKAVSRGSREFYIIGKGFKTGSVGSH